VPKVLEAFAGEQLAELETKGLLRAPDDGARRSAAAEAAARLGEPLVDASSNDYLGLASLVVSRETDVQGVPVGAGASRLIHGTREAQLVLEEELATWVMLESALLFTSGYAANLGLLGALGVEGTVVVSDRLNHASTIDGCRLSRAEVVVLPHLDPGALQGALRAHQAARARWVVTEACFSMDGDGPDLRVLRRLCDEHGAGLVVDEAHSLGVFGPRGSGRCAEAGISPDALIGTLGKAVGTQGAFVAGSATLRALLWNRARSFVFSTATSPLLAQVTRLHVQRAQAADDARSTLRSTATALRVALRSHGIPVETGLNSPIVPVVIGDNDRAVRAAEYLASQGILAQAIRPPTVPIGAARLRLTVSSAWPPGAVERVASAVAAALAVKHG